MLGPSYASDIWSLGCTIIELLTGRPPFAEIHNGMSGEKGGFLPYLRIEVQEADPPSSPSGSHVPNRRRRPPSHPRRILARTSVFPRRMLSQRSSDASERGTVVRARVASSSSRLPRGTLLCLLPFLSPSKLTSCSPLAQLRPQDSIPFLRRVSTFHQPQPSLPFSQPMSASPKRQSLPAPHRVQQNPEKRYSSPYQVLGGRSEVSLAARRSEECYGTQPSVAIPLLHLRSSPTAPAHAWVKTSFGKSTFPTISWCFWL
jgi:serine/threonine protein kinase